MPDNALQHPSDSRNLPDSYRWLENRFRRIAGLDDAAGVLHWDQQVMMPDGAGEARGEQMAALAVVVHELLTAGEVGDRLDEAERASGELDAWQRANLAEMRRSHRHSTAVPADLVEALAMARQVGEAAWRRARAEDRFDLVVEPLTTLLSLVRQEAASKAEALGTTPYQALLDGYEPGLTEAQVDRVFGRLAEALPPLLERVLARQASEPAPLRPEGPFPIAAQEALGRRLMALAGFDFDRGRLDVSLHPFCGGSSSDIRITTRYDERDFTSSLMGVLHETGHGLYELGLPEAWRNQPVGASRGMAMHESQSLLIEMQASRSPEFVGFLAPLAAAAFGRTGAAWTAENLRRLYQRVERSLIRVDADEVTYPLHVILRTRLERALLADDLPVRELPVAWNAGMRELLAIEPPSDRLGCLQDIHWYDGTIGYFPTYTFGAVAAAQLFAAAVEAEPTIPADLGRGDLTTLVGWLRREVHGRASSMSSAEILTAATGRSFDAEAFLGHLERRYLG